MEFKRLPMSKEDQTLTRSICIIKGCFKVLIDNNNGNGVTCLNGCCPAHTQQYGKKGPPKIMERTKTYQRRDLQVEESNVTTAHGIRQITTRRRLSDSEPWDYEFKYYNTLGKGDKCSRGTRICIDHGNHYTKCTLGCQPCEHGVDAPRQRCKDCYPALKCRTKDCDSIKSHRACGDMTGLCVYCINDLNGNLTIEQLNLQHLKELGYDLQTGSQHPSLSYYIDGTMEGEGHFNELNWENDEGTLTEGHNSLRQYPTNAHYQRMEDIHDAKSDLSKGSGMYTYVLLYLSNVT